MTPQNNRAPFLCHIKLCASSKNPLMNSNWTYRPETSSSGHNWRFFLPMWPWNFMDDIENNRTSPMLLQVLCITSYPLVNSNWSFSPETPNFGQYRPFFLKPCDLAIWRMTLKNNRAPLLCHLGLFASFRCHWWTETGVTVRKRPIWFKLNDV